MKADFFKSVDILVKAYLNDTLDKMDCAACGVGTLIQGYGNFKPKHSGKKDGINSCRFIDEQGKEVGIPWSSYCHPFGVEILDVLKIIPYTEYQICEIEKAFLRGCGIDENNFNGLVAVFNVLAEIHGVDLESKESAILQLTK